MRTFKALLVTFLLLCLLWWLYQLTSWSPMPKERHQLVSTTVESAQHQEAISQARRILALLPDALNVPSASVAVAVNGEIIWSEAVGYADLALKKPATPQTIYRIGSTSKAVTATALMIAVQEKKLDLYQSVPELLKNYPQKQWDFNTAQLLSHTAGLPDYEDLGLKGLFYSALNAKDFTSVEEGITLFKDIPLLYEPGTHFKYNSFDIVLASLVLERVTGTSFSDFLQSRLFQVLDMQHTFPDRGGKKPEGRAEFYETSEHDRFRVWHTFGFPKPEQNLSYKWAGGGLLSTPTDLVKMGNALLNDTLLFNRKVRDTFFTPQHLRNGEINEQNYALGWRSNTAYTSACFPPDTPKVWIVHHAGVSKGSMNFLCLFPNENVVIDVAVNGRSDKVNFPPFWNFTMEIAAPFLFGPN